MTSANALKLALELYHMPSRVRSARGEPLHDGLDELLSVAAGDEAVLTSAASRLKRQPDVVQAAARFYVEQILLAPDADSYRVLGADRDAPAAELRRNMALLLRFLHPDHETSGKMSVYAGRVIAAWDDLKSPERRGAYDERFGRQRAQTSLATKTPPPARPATGAATQRNLYEARTGAPRMTYASDKHNSLFSRALRYLLRPGT